MMEISSFSEAQIPIATEYTRQSPLAVPDMRVQSIPVWNQPAPDMYPMYHGIQTEQPSIRCMYSAAIQSDPLSHKDGSMAARI